MTILTAIQAEFLRNARGDTFIKFFDPAYVRADIIILDRESKSLYAVLHEQEHLIGAVADDIFEALCANDEVHLTSFMSNGKELHLTAPLSVSGK